MRIKKRSIQEKINPDVVAKQTRDVVDAVKGELKSDDDTAVDFIKGMTGGNVSEDGDTYRGISLEQTKDVADFLAKALTIVTGHQHTISAGIKPGMFDLDMHGSPNNAGGSYKAYSNGSVIRPGFKGSPMVYNFKTDKGVGAIEKRYNNYMYNDNHPDFTLDEDTDDERASRAIDFGVGEPEMGKQVDRNMPKTGSIDYGEKKGGEPDLPFEGTKKKKVVEGRRVVKTIKIRDLKK